MLTINLIANLIIIIELLMTTDGAVVQPKRPPKLAPASGPGSRDKQSADQSLLKRILNNYNKEAMPEKPLVVSLHVLLIKVKSTVEKEGIFESVVALFIEWRDKRMAWNPADYDNLTLLAFDSDQVWLPDIAMTNSADHLYSISRDSRFIVRVAHDGWLKFVPTGTARTWCDLNLLTFPFDFQECRLEFESWSLDSSTMTFDGKSQLMLDSNFGSCQFWLCQLKAMTYNHTYGFAGETFTRVEFSLIVKRKSTFYILNLIFPCTTLSLISLLVFVIPSVETTGDRIGFGTTNMLTLVVFQTIVTAEMPKTSDAVTALSKYIIALIIISAVGITESVVVERIMELCSSAPSPILLRMMEGVPAFHSDKKPNKSDDEDDELEQIRRNLKRKTLSAKHRHHHHVTTGQTRQQILNFVAAQEAAAAIARQISPNTGTRLANNRGPAGLTMLPGGSSSTSSESSTQSQNYCCPIGDSASSTLKSSSKNSSLIRSSISVTETSSNVFTGGLSNVSEDGSGNDNDDAASGLHFADVETRRQAKLRRQIKRIQNNRQWRQIAYKIDTISFITCMALALLVPMALFLPLLLVQDNCSDDSKVLLEDVLV